MILDQIKITIWSITKKWLPIRSWFQITRSSDHSIFWIYGSESHMKVLKNLLNTLSIIMPLVIFFSLAIFKKNLKFAKKSLWIFPNFYKFLSWDGENSDLKFPITFRSRSQKKWSTIRSDPDLKLGNHDLIWKMISDPILWYIHICTM